MDVKIAPDWKELLSPEFEKPYFAALTQFVRQEYATHRIYPRGSNIFRAFDKCPFDKLKVVIIGQDPYHGPGQANGLCFSVGDGVPFLSLILLSEPTRLRRISYVVFCL